MMGMPIKIMMLSSNLRHLHIVEGETRVKWRSRMPSWWRECPRDVEKPSKVIELMMLV